MKKEKNIIRNRKGYLNEDFLFFHLKDKKGIKFEFHYHDFNKIIIFLSGNVTYLIEGKAYKLKPRDILLVSSNDIHKAIIDPNGTYERIIIWVNSSFLQENNINQCNLLTCFKEASKKKFNLLRLNSEILNSVLHQLEEAYKSSEFGSYILRNALFLQFMVYINRMFLGNENHKELSDIEYDKNIGRVLDYINENLNKELSIDNISSKFYMSKYYLMHKFKKQTGYTIHNYIQNKRLIMANSLIKKGKSVTEACVECGFGDYSNFIRAFKKMFGLSPKKYYKRFDKLE
ncbi:AraC family transcriptional regulator [Haloimpatiens sp. FM7330]|uniref:AraC family transcriptional regulator n=1 Tax=Haloimpatiens sp. FM7330 TaxID=3298610 RepID=UPI003628D820